MRATILNALRVAIVMAVCAGAKYCCGQGIVTGSMSGVVQDPSAAVIQGAVVTAVQNATNTPYTTRTNSAGSFQLPNLPIGAYTVNIQVAGFTPMKVENVSVQTGTQTPLGILTLKIGASEAVTVEGATALLQPDSALISEQFDTQKTADLPIGNGFDIVALLTPGVAPSGGSVLQTTMERSFQQTEFVIGTTTFNWMGRQTTTPILAAQMSSLGTPTPLQKYK